MQIRFEAFELLLKKFIMLRWILAETGIQLDKCFIETLAVRRSDVDYDGDMINGNVYLKSDAFYHLFSSIRKIFLF